MTERLIDRLSRRFHDRRLRIEVPEWGDDGEPFIVWSKPFTGIDEQALAHYIEKDSPKGFIEILVRKAEDEEGNRLLSKDDGMRLFRNTSFSVVKRVAMEIYRSAYTGTEEEVEDASGN